MPKQFEPGVLYRSRQYDIAIHLCACGCGVKIRTPLGPTEWSIEDTKNGPTLNPSVGNWQQSCQSHYWIRGGEIKWAEAWTPEQVAAGRRAEQERREEYYANRSRSFMNRLRKVFAWIKHKLWPQR
jgi:hypothetical protein